MDIAGKEQTQFFNGRKAEFSVLREMTRVADAFKDMAEEYLTFIGEKGNWTRIDNQGRAALCREAVRLYGNTKKEIVEGSKLFETHEINRFEESLSIGVVIVTEGFNAIISGNEFLAIRRLSVASMILGMCQIMRSNGYVYNINKYLPSEIISNILSEKGKQASNKRHATNRNRATTIKAWYIDNHSAFKSMDRAAEKAQELFGVSFRTAREHIGKAAKDLRSTGKA
jgi:hypothetical protein